MVSFKFRWDESKFIRPSLNPLKSKEAENIIDTIMKDYEKNSGITMPGWYSVLIGILTISGLILWPISIWVIEFNIYLLIFSFFLFFCGFILPCLHNRCENSNFGNAKRYFNKKKEGYNLKLKPYNLEIVFNLVEKSKTTKVESDNKTRTKIDYWIDGDIEFRTIGQEPTQPESNSNANPLSQPNDNNILSDKPSPASISSNKLPKINNNNNNNQNPFTANNNIFNPPNFNNQENNNQNPFTVNNQQNHFHDNSLPPIDNKFKHNPRPYQPAINKASSNENDLHLD